MGHLPRVLSFAACLAWLGYASAATLDFEQFATGDIVNQVDGVTVMGINPELGAEINAARVFDSANPSADPDLGTPNNQCGGPGNGTDADVGPGGAFENCTPLGKVLIIDDDLVGAPDDIDKASIDGAILRFDFSAPTTVQRIDILDTNTNGPNPRVELFAGETLAATVFIPQMPNNGRVTIRLGATSGVTRMDIYVQGSGAVDSVDFVPSEPPEPSIELKKQVSLTGGEPFFDADTQGAGPIGALGADATYRLIVTNIGEEVLVNARITDETLGLIDVRVPGGPLDPDEERIIEAGDTGFSALFFEDRCDKGREKVNIARVDAEGENSKDPVSDTDPAFVVCEEPRIELLKQVSLTGNAPFSDADTPATAPKGPLGADATYRLIVRNIGSETLVDLTISDATLGLVDVPVPGGGLGPGEERTIDAGGAFDMLFFEGRCDQRGNKSNIATVAAKGENSGAQVSSDNPANVNCVGEPEIELLKQVSLTGGAPFFDADTPGDAVTGQIGAGATYRLVVRNVGTETLIDAVINDDALGLANVPVPGGALNPGDERVITTGTSGFSALFFEERCDSTGNKLNIANVDAEGEDSGESVSDIDPANVKCVGEPEIELLKQVSVTGDEPFFDADTQGDAVTGLLGADATYRLIVRNIGTETLTNAVVNDAMLGLVDVPVPGGALNPGDERVITSGDTGFGALFFEERCDSTGNKENIASVDAEGVDSGDPVSSDDPANVRCIGEPEIELLKQVSLTGGAPFFDADTPGDAPTGLLGADATYRLIVRNIGTERLVDAVISDVTLGLVDVPAPGGALNPGDERVITSGDTGFGALFSEERCDSAGNKSNIATVSAQGEGSGQSVSDDDPANVNCEAPVCTIAVDKTCAVQPPPSPGPFDCKDAKPIDALTMIWNGAGPVTVTTTGTPSSFTAAPGDEVTVSGLSGQGNDVEWQLGGLGTSTFHLSCSDKDMNGPEDCGTAQGNGKKRSGVNQWVFEGMAGSGQALDCTVAPLDPEPGADECTIAPIGGISSCASLKASKQKLTNITFRYTGGGCGASSNSQKGHKCEGSVDGSSPASISGKDGGGATVEPGGLVTLSEDEAKEANISNGGGTQVNEIHTSCSQPLNPGDVFGSLTLVGLNGETGSSSSSVTYNYAVTNTGNTEVSLSSLLDDQLGELLDSAPALLAPDDTVTVSVIETLSETTTNIVTATGNVSGVASAVCEAMDTVKVTVTTPPTPPPSAFNCKDAKKLTALTMIWNGPSPVSISGGEVSISGINAGDEVTFNVTDKDMELSVSGAANGTSTFHTSCSDKDMNGPEDCGKAQGNGKKDDGGLNLWVLEGITGEGGALNCTQ